MAGIGIRYTHDQTRFWTGCAIDMRPDPEFLRKHYGSLSDEALLDLDRADLVETAQHCYDDELQRRGLVSVGPPPQPADRPVAKESEGHFGEDQPDWLDDSTEVVSWEISAGQSRVPGEDAREALGDAGIPCYLEMSELEDEPSRGPKPTHWLRLVVPSKLHLQARSTLERDIHNQGLEDTWRAHLESLSDQELRTVDPEVTFCGLFDQIERITRAHREELVRRGFKLGRPAT